MDATVESHVLEKMRQPLLIIGLVHGTRFDEKPSADARPRLPVGQDHVTKPVLQNPETRPRIRTEIASLLRERNGGGPDRRSDEKGEERKQEPESHGASGRKSPEGRKTKAGTEIFFAPLRGLEAESASSAAMIWLYRLLFAPALLVLAPRYLLRMRRRGGYSEDFRQRFGAHPDLPRNEDRRRIWIQAVSVGEMLAIGPLLRELKKDGAEVYLTTTTSTGRRIAAERYAEVVAKIGYFPLDWRPFVSRSWDRIKPDLVILTEGERWPEHLRQANARGVAVISLNSRLSDRTFRRLRLLGPGAQLCLRGISLHLAASRLDAERLTALGVEPARIKTVGNLKLDVNIEPASAAETTNLRSELGLLPGPVLLGSSTWPGEEAALLQAWRRARSGGHAGSLLLVPRHAERRAEIEALLREAGVTFHFRTRGPASQTVEVSVADTTGELRRLTQIADVVFVGKSLPPHTEGQTPVEAAALGKPLLFGPGMANFRTIAGELLAAGAAQSVADADQLPAAVISLLSNRALAGDMSSKATMWHGTNRGSLERSLAEIRRFLA